jgi:hypothetical protein
VWCVCVATGGVQSGNGKLQLGAGLGMLHSHEARGRAAQHAVIQRGALEQAPLPEASLTKQASPMERGSS